jgi:hypothetical protein
LLPVSGTFTASSGRGSDLDRGGSRPAPGAGGDLPGPSMTVRSGRARLARPCRRAYDGSWPLLGSGSGLGRRQVTRGHFGGTRRGFPEVL